MAPRVAGGLLANSAGQPCPQLEHLARASGLLPVLAAGSGLAVDGHVVAVSNMAASVILRST